MSYAVEVNFDGLIGPTHNYAGLAPGNLASAANQGQTSSPRAAALQGLAKMKYLADLGLAQAVLPPHPRPRFDMLHGLGFRGTEAQMLEAAYRTAPHLLAQLYSASAMWTANAATVSPSADTADGRVHFTPANLVTSFHRSIEGAQTTHILRQIFGHTDHFCVHDPLPAQSDFADEGAANILRLCPNHAQAGLEVMVYGRDAALPKELLPKKHPARQTRAAADAIFRAHGVTRSLALLQNPDAIDAGVFHNDVISVASESLLMSHELAFADGEAAFAALQDACPWARLMIVHEEEVPLTEAVKSYLFNSQIVRVGDGTMHIIAPTECEETPSVRAWLARAEMENDNPIGRVHFLDVRESMRNGGGPACLRLRVVLTEAEVAATHHGIWLTPARYAELVAWVEQYYRDRLTPADLADPQLAVECLEALTALESILDLNIV